MEKEKIEAGELALYKKAETALLMATAHRDMIQQHIGNRYKFGPMDTLDDETGEITRFTQPQLVGDENGDRAATKTPSEEQSKRSNTGTE